MEEFLYYVFEECLTHDAQEKKMLELFGNEKGKVLVGRRKMMEMEVEENWKREMDRAKVGERVKERERERERWREDTDCNVVMTQFNLRCF